MLVKKRKPKRCPRCGAERIARIQYGMPIMNEQLEADLAAGRVVLGGCCEEIDAPAWCCTSCALPLHRAPKL